MYGGIFQDRISTSFRRWPSWATGIRFFPSESRSRRRRSAATLLPAARCGARRSAIRTRSPPTCTAIYKKLGRADGVACRRVWPRRRMFARKSSRRTKRASTICSISAIIRNSSRRRGSGVSIANSWRIGTGCAAFPASDLKAVWSPRTSSPVSGRSSARFIISTTTSSATRCRRRDCARASGNPSSPTTCGATGACCTAGWAIFPR